MDVEVDMVRGDDGRVGETVVCSKGGLKSYRYRRVVGRFYMWRELELELVVTGRGAYG